MKKVYVGAIREFEPLPGCEQCKPTSRQYPCERHSMVTGWRWATLDAEGTAPTHAEAWAAAEAA